MLSQYARLFARILIPDGMGFLHSGRAGLSVPVREIPIH